MEVVVCHCTCPDAEVAERIADALVAERLAACVNILPGLRSVYRWQGAVERADEVLLLVKTTPDRVATVAALVAALHPYELPEADRGRSRRRPARLPRLGRRETPPTTPPRGE